MSFYNSHLNGYELHITLFLICISVLTRDVHLFMCFWPFICHIWKNVLYSFLNQVVFVSVVESYSFLYILDFNSLSDIWFAKFPSIAWLSLYSLDYVLDGQKFYIVV